MKLSNYEVGGNLSKLKYMKCCCIHSTRASAGGGGGNLIVLIYSKTQKKGEKSVEWGGEKICTTSRLLLDPDSESILDILRVTCRERLNNSCDPGYLNVGFDDKPPTRQFKGSAGPAL